MIELYVDECLTPTTGMYIYSRRHEPQRSISLRDQSSPWVDFGHEPAALAVVRYTDRLFLKSIGQSHTRAVYPTLVCCIVGNNKIVSVENGCRRWSTLPKKKNMQTQDEE